MISLKIDEGLLAEIDAAAGRGRRTAWIEEACLHRLGHRSGRSPAAGKRHYSAARSTEVAPRFKRAAKP